MKLPERVKVLKVNSDDITPLLEAIVRDCAIMCDKVVVDYKLAISAERKVARLCKEYILARYEI
jgi:hypothetical protein